MDANVMEAIALLLVVALIIAIPAAYMTARYRRSSVTIQALGLIQQYIDAAQSGRTECAAKVFDELCALPRHHRDQVHKGFNLAETSLRQGFAVADTRYQNALMPGVPRSERSLMMSLREEQRQRHDTFMVLSTKYFAAMHLEVEVRSE